MSGIVNAIFGNPAQSNAMQQANQAAQTSANAQSQLINGALMPIYNQMLQDYQQNYAPLEGTLSQQMQGLEGSFNPGNLTQLGLGALTNPTEMSALTGVNMPAISNEAMSYFMNPGGTLSGVNGAGGMGLNYFSNLAQNGMDPAVSNNAYNNFYNSEQRSINSIRNSLGSGTPNLSGTLQDLNEQALEGRANLGSNLAAQDQGLRTQGIEGLLGTAGNIDTQTQQMLNQGYGIANQQNSEGIQNLLSALGLGQNTLANIQNYIGQGKNILPGAASGMQQISNQYGQAGAAAASNAANLAANYQNPWSNMLSTGLQAYGMFG